MKQSQFGSTINHFRIIDCCNSSYQTSPILYVKSVNLLLYICQSDIHCASFDRLQSVVDRKSLKLTILHQVSGSKGVSTLDPGIDIRIFVGAWQPHLRLVSQTSIVNKNAMLKPLLISLLYVSSCMLALLQATRESTPQPLGLLIVAMVMLPVLMSIIAGLPVNCMNFRRN